MLVGGGPPSVSMSLILVPGVRASRPRSIGSDIERVFSFHVFFFKSLV